MPSPLFQQTKPFGEDVVFRSSTTGEHDLDSYLEAAERGGKTLGEMMELAFDSSGSPRFVDREATPDIEAELSAAAALESKNAAALSESNAAASAIAAGASADAAAISAAAAELANDAVQVVAGALAGGFVSSVDGKTGAVRVQGKIFFAMGA